MACNQLLRIGAEMAFGVAQAKRVNALRWNNPGARVLECADLV
jgi:hypothetical protein